jgi:Zn-dependent protease with chaperone function
MPDVGEFLVRTLAAIVALAPAAIGWWRGRALVRLIDDPALPERLVASRRQATVIAISAMAALIYAWPGELWWTLPLLVLGRLVASYPARRALFGETWSLARYVSFYIRLIVGVYGFWLVILFTPFLVIESGDRAWLTEIVLGFLIVLGNFRWTSIFRRLMRSRPVDHPALVARFAGLVEATGLQMPRFERVDLHGGVFANAVALPSLRGSAVLVSETLLDRLETDEVLGIAAHELAHLEQFNRKRLRQLAVTAWICSAIALALPLVVRRLAPGAPSVLVLLWTIPVVATLAARARHRQQHETDSDLRAVALTGNPEALVRALTKLHLIARVPRRWDTEIERQATHPSLARRIQAIRAAAGTPAAMLGETAPFAAAIGAASVTFRDEGLVWTESAASAHTIGYGDLEELRVRPAASGAAELIAVDRGGRHWEMPLASADLARAQSVLDVVDTRLAKPVVRARVSPMVARLLTLVAAVAAMCVSQIGVVLVMVLAAIRTDRVMALAASTAAIVASGVLARDFGQQAGSLAVLMAIALVTCAAGLGVTVFVNRQEPIRSSSYSFVNVLGVMAALAWVPIASSGASVITVHQAARAWPAAAILPIAFAVANLRRPRRGARWLSLAATVCGLSAAVTGSTMFLDATGRDPFLRPATSISPRTVVAQTATIFPADFTVSDLRLSPGGAAVLLVSLDNEDRRTVHVGVAGGPLTSFEMEDGAFLDDHRLLLLDTPREGSVVREIDLDAGNQVLWEQHVIGMTATRLLLDRSSESWQLLGYDRKRVTASAAGRVGSSDVDEHEWNAGKAQDAWRRALAASADAALVLETRYSRRLFDGVSWELAQFVEPSERMTSRLLAITPGGATEIAVSRLYLSCEVSPLIGEPPICVSFDGTRSRIFTIDPATGAITARALLPGQFLLFHADAGGWAVGWWRGSAVAVNVLQDTPDALRYTGQDQAEIGQVTVSGLHVAVVVPADRGSIVRVGEWK